MVINYYKILIENYSYKSIIHSNNLRKIKCPLKTGGHFTSLPSDAPKKIEESEKPLRIKFGIDPTRARLHLGHFVPLRLLRQLQDDGHEIHLILGTFTAQMGDPSGKDKARPILGENVVKENAERILEQVSKVLSPGFEVHRNHEFFEGMNIPFFLTRLASQFTVARMMSRDGFRKRGQAGVAMHELITPLLQGWDSVMVKADVEIGGTDQLFNFQVSRELQAKQGQTPQVCMMTPIINGTDGRKMSKSLDNCIWLEEPPEQIFGKVMSISDDVMSEWIPLLTDIESFPDHPMRRKEMLARDIVRQIHGEEAAEFAASHFKSLIQNKQATDIVSISSGSAIEVVVSLRGCSKSEARRLIKGGGLKACNKLSSIAELKRVSDENFPIPAGWLIKIGKRQWASTVD